MRPSYSESYYDTLRLSLRSSTVIHRASILIQYVSLRSLPLFRPVKVQGLRRSRFVGGCCCL